MAGLEGFTRAFNVADRVCWITLSALRRPSGDLRFLVVWQPPGPPARWTPALMAVFDAGKRQAIADLRRDWEAAQ